MRIFSIKTMVALTLFGAIQLAHGASTLSVDSAKSNSLVIYPDKSALVTQNFAIMTETPLKLKVAGLSQEVVPQSLQGVADDQSVKQIFWPNRKLNENQLFNDLQGQVVELFGRGLEKPQAVVLLAWRNGKALVQTKDGRQYLIDQKTSGFFISWPKGYLPASTWLFEPSLTLPNTNTKHLQLSYRLHGIDYSLHYQLTISDDHQSASLTQQADLSNNTSQSFPKAKIMIVGGHLGKRPSLRPRMMMLAAEGLKNTNQDAQSLGTMNFTNIAADQDLPAHSQLKLSVNTYEALPIESYYQLKTRLRSLVGQTTPLQPQRVIAWQAPATLAAGKIKLYEQNQAEQALHWTGSAQLDNVAKGAQILTRLGTSYELPVEFKLLDSQELKGKLTQQWQIRVHNLSGKTLKLVLQENDPSLLKLKGQSVEGNEISLMLAPGTVRELELSATYKRKYR